MTAPTFDLERVLRATSAALAGTEMADGYRVAVEEITGNDDIETQLSEASRAVVSVIVPDTLAPVYALHHSELREYPGNRPPMLVCTSCGQPSPCPTVVKLDEIVLASRDPHHKPVMPTPVTGEDR